RRHTRFSRDWSSDVCSSDLVLVDEEVFFIDQHVAHERVLFERLQGLLASGPLPSQEVLLREPLELSPPERVLLAEWRPALERLRSEERRVGEEWGSRVGACG